MIHKYDLAEMAKQLNSTLIILKVKLVCRAKVMGAPSPTPSPPGHRSDRCSPGGEQHNYPHVGKKRK